MKQVWTIQNGTLITPFETIPKGVVVFRDEKIVAVGRAAEVKIPKEAAVIDASNRIVAPGFIDIHVHGAKGRDVMEASYEAIHELAVFLSHHGTTSFLPTTVPASRSALLNVVRVIRTAMNKGTEGAEVLGVHLEGSCISPERSGALDPSYIRLPSLDEFEEIWEASEGTVKIVTLAPEIGGADKLIQKQSNMVCNMWLIHSMRCGVFTIENLESLVQFLFAMS